jgi:predicted RND superfamily exporter protein
MKADISNPDVLKTLLVIEERMKAYTHSNPNGIADTVAMLNHAMSGVKTIPETKEEVENLWFFVEGKSELDNMVTKEKTEALVSCMINSTDPAYINGLENFINQYISRFNKNITSIANTPGNPEIANVEKVFIGNLLMENGVAFDEKTLDAFIALLVSADKNFASKLDETALVAYLSGDESEIPFSKADAVKIASAISALPRFDTESIMSAVTKAFTGAADYDKADVDALARSLSGIITEASTKGRVKSLIGLVKTEYPQTALATEENLNYSVAPFVWKTIPAISQDSTAIVNQTRIEEVDHTGYAYIAEQIRREILRDQVLSLAITLLAVFLFNTLVFKSVKQGLISMVAMPFTLIINYGLMALLRIPLDIATVTVGSISIIGIDYTLHYIARYSIEIGKSGNDKLKATLLTFATAGKAIIFNALSVGLGFAALCFSNIVAVRNLGFLLAITMIVSCITSLVLLPAAMSIGKAVSKRVPIGSQKSKVAVPEDSV